MSYETIRESGGIYQRFWGAVDSLELYDSLKEIPKDPCFASAKYVIKDFLGVDVFNAKVKTIVEGLALNKVWKNTNPDIVVAVVTTHEEIIATGQSAMSYRVDSYPRRVFPTLAEARAWIAEIAAKRGA